MKNKQKGFLGTATLIIIAIILAGGAYLYFTGVSKNNYDEQLAVLGAKGISNLLREDGDGASGIQKEITKRILNESTDIGEKIGLARILGESNTPEALATLSKVSFTTKDSELYRSVIEQMGRMGSTDSEQQIKEMTKVAKDSWGMVAKLEEVNPKLYYVFGSILAKLGNSDGINFLRSEAIRGGSTISALNSSGNISAKIAMDFSSMVQGRESISILTESLKINDPTSTEFVWSGQALASIGYEEGASALIEWAKNAPDSCGELAEIWLGNFKDTHAVEVMRGFSPLLKFQSQHVKDQVKKVAKKYQISYSITSSDVEVQKNTITDNEKINYAGKYTFTETGVQSTSKLAEYLLVIYKNDTVSKNVLHIYTDINEYKSTEILNIQAVDENGTLKIIFDSYNEDNSHSAFQKGDTLFTLIAIGENKFKINWNKMTPKIYQIEDLTNNFFVKHSYLAD